MSKSKKVRPMRVRLFRTYALLFSIMLLAIMVLLGNLILEKNRNASVSMVQEKLREDVRTITTMFDGMENLSRQINASQTFLSVFESANLETDADNWFDAHPTEKQEAEEVLQTINGGTSAALRITVYNLKGDLISCGTLPVTDSVVESMYTERMEVLEGQYDLIEHTGNDFAVSGPHPDFWGEDEFWESDNGSKNNIVSFLTYLKHPYSDEILGIIEVQYDFASFADLSFMAETGESRTLLYDDWGRTNVSDSEKQTEMETFYTTLLESYEKTGDYRRTYRENGRTWVAVGVKEYNSGWMLIRITSMSALDEPYMGVYVGFVAGTLFLLGVLLATIYAISLSMAKPMAELANSIEQVGMKQMDPLPGFSQKYVSLETERIREAFDKMLARLNASIDLEMKAYLRALQSQMDPHFLYNCLDIIADVSEEDESERAARMCEILAKMLRYRANYLSDFVPLSEEIEDIRNYMEMEKARYEDKFSFTIDIPETLNDLNVPHVLLQPLVENCFKHGFMRASGPWTINVRAEILKSHWFIHVRDNGAGMTQEELKLLRARIDECRGNISENYSKLKIGGMGLVNTYMRLSLLSRGEITMTIESAENKGTEVTIGGIR